MDQLTEKEYEGRDFARLDLQEADLSGIIFIDCTFTSCNLSLVKLSKTTLRDIQDLRSAFNYSIDPSVNKIKKARFSLTGLPGLLEKYDIDISL